MIWKGCRVFVKSYLKCASALLKRVCKILFFIIDALRCHVVSLLREMAPGTVKCF